MVSWGSRNNCKYHISVMKPLKYIYVYIPQVLQKVLLAVGLSWWVYKEMGTCQHLVEI